MPLVSVPEWAKLEGISRVAAYKRIKSGKVKAVDGKVDTDQAAVDWARNKDTLQSQRGANSGKVQPAQAVPPMRGRPRKTESLKITGDGRKGEHVSPLPAGPVRDIADWIIDEVIQPEDKQPLAESQRQEAILRVRERLRNDRIAEKTLLKADEVRAAWEKMISSARSKFLLLPAKLAPKIDHEMKPIEREAIIERAIKSVLTALSSGNESG